ncbi:hypothetical protein Tco_1103737 [Tanacetum coccineum]
MISSGYGVLVFKSLWFLVKFRRRYPVEEPWATADAIQSIDAFKSAEEIRNQPKTADAEKIQESIVEEEVRESGIKSLGDVPLDQFGEANANLDADESLFDTESEIKFIRKEVPKSIYNGSQFNKDATQGTNLESSLSKKVADKIKELFPRMVVDAFEERLPKMLFDTLKTILPDLL